MKDSSARTGKHPPPGDTVLNVLYGISTRDTGSFTPERIAALRAAIDPIYPPVLLFSDANRPQPLPSYWTVLFLGSEGNRRDGIMVNDGGGTAAHIRATDKHGFKGTFRGAGLVMSDSGYYCAWRVQER